MVSPNRNLPFRFVVEKKFSIRKSSGMKNRRRRKRNGRALHRVSYSFLSRRVENATADRALSSRSSLARAPSEGRKSRKALVVSGTLEPSQAGSQGSHLIPPGRAPRSCLLACLETERDTGDRETRVFAHDTPRTARAAREWRRRPLSARPALASERREERRESREERTRGRYFPRRVSRFTRRSHAPWAARATFLVTWEAATPRVRRRPSTDPPSPSSRGRGRGTTRFSGRRGEGPKAVSSPLWAASGVPAPAPSDRRGSSSSACGQRTPSTAPPRAWERPSGARRVAPFPVPAPRTAPWRPPTGGSPSDSTTSPSEAARTPPRRPGRT